MTDKDNTQMHMDLPVKGRVLAVPPGQPFARVLARHILGAHAPEADPLALADVTVWLPTQRALKAMREAFVAEAGGELVLPRLKVLRLGEDESDPLLFDTDIDPTPIMPELARLLYLMRQVQAKDSRLSVAQAFDNTQSLAAVFDRLMHYDIPFEQLRTLVPPDMATHWEQNLLFLRIVFEFYPEWLAESGRVDGAQKRRHLLDAQADKYRREGTPHPVYAAGFADTTPAGRAVLRAILAGERGVLVLPSVDAHTLPLLARDLPPTHPHAATAQLLRALGVAPEAITVLADTTARSRLWQQALCAPDGMDCWQAAPDKSALGGLNLIEAPNDRTEAEVIAYLMREVLETPNKTCALVTPSRVLAQRVADRLRGWGVQVNDSAGVPLRQTPAGSFFSLLADMVASRFAPVPTAMLIRHPFVYAGMNKKDWRKRAAALERLVLRGIRPPAGLEGLRRRLDEAVAERLARPGGGGEGLSIQADLAREALAALEAASAPLRHVSGDAPLTVWVEAHAQSARALTLRPDGGGGDIFLREADGEALAALLDDWRRTDSHGLAFNARAYGDWVTTMADRTAVRLRHGQHPRLFLWGSPESRLQAVDRVIIGGCNEGTWPRRPSPDPWLSRDMVLGLGLPDPESQIGLNAQDFLHLACMPEVYLTRPLRQEGVEMVPSRYWSRLQARLQAGAPGLYDGLAAKAQGWVGAVDAFARPDLPEKVPPAEVLLAEGQFPKRWSASTVRDLMQCPYRVYAAKVLGLEALPAFEEAPEASDRGILLHTCLQAFFQQVPGLPPPFDDLPVTRRNQVRAEAHLLDIGRHAFGRVASRAMRAVWWPRFERAAAEFADTLAEHHAQGRTPHAVETQESLTLPEGVTLHARADRLDHTPDGLVVMDYKTGAAPSKQSIVSGREPQLAIELLLLRAKGQTPVAAEYWSVAGSDGGFKAAGGIAPDDVADRITEAEHGIARLTEHFIAQKAPLLALPGGVSPLKPDGLCTRCDYAGVCRYREWQ
jgi:ATP-dependent helicase/nuclease subunit B